jgi:predicted DNA binding CopG/RHH family protein
MSNINKPIETEAPWESGELGRNEQHVKRASDETESAVDSALGLQLISIRLQKKMIEDLKFIAKAHGIGYQPLVRDVLDRFIEHEVKKIIWDAQARRQLEEKERVAAKSATDNEKRAA